MLQIIVCADGADAGHTVLRYIPAASNAFSFIRSHHHQVLTSSIKHSAPTLFHAFLSPHAKSFIPPKLTAIGVWPVFSQSFSYDASLSKLMWTLTPSIRGGIRYAEARLSDLICQHDCQALQFKGHGKNLSRVMGSAPIRSCRWLSRQHNSDSMVRMRFSAILKL